MCGMRIDDKLKTLLTFYIKTGQSVAQLKVASYIAWMHDIYIYMGPLLLLLLLCGYIIIYIYIYICMNVVLAVVVVEKQNVNV